MTRRKFNAILLSGALFAGGYLATGLPIVQPDEAGVVRRFGAVLKEPWEPGLHWGTPWGIDRLDRIKVHQTRTITAGAASNAKGPLYAAPDPSEDDFLTGDLNLVTTEALIVYRVRDPVA